jgi:ClpP class serine protease
MTRDAVRQATRDPEVKGIYVRVDSPGGTVAGTGDLAEAIAAAAKVKPTHARVEDKAASAALHAIAG